MDIYLDLETNELVFSRNTKLDEKYLHLIPNQNGSSEKHLPKVTLSNNRVQVSIGEFIHPMDKEHLIKNIIIITSFGFYVRELNEFDEPIFEIYLDANEVLISVYEYCNLHGLWKLEFQEDNL